MKTDSKLNGSVEMLAKAMKEVFSEAMESAVEPIHSDLEGIRNNMATKEDVNTTNVNMQAQFAEQEKKLGNLLSKR